MLLIWKISMKFANDEYIDLIQFAPSKYERATDPIDDD